MRLDFNFPYSITGILLASAGWQMQFSPPAQRNRCCKTFTKPTWTGDRHTVYNTFWQRPPLLPPDGLFRPLAPPSIFQHTGSFHGCGTLHWHQEHKLKSKEFNPHKVAPSNHFFMTSVTSVVDMIPLNKTFVIAVYDLMTHTAIYKWCLNQNCSSHLWIDPVCLPVTMEEWDEL